MTTRDEKKYLKIILVIKLFGVALCQQNEKDMNTTNFTIGQEVTFNGAFGVNVITSIKGNKITTFEKSSNMTYTKLAKSLRPYARKSAHWNEQDIAAGQAKYNHGATVYSCIDISGIGCRMVWDENKQQIVNHNELS